MSYIFFVEDTFSSRYVANKARIYRIPGSSLSLSLSSRSTYIFSRKVVHKAYTRKYLSRNC